MVTLTEEQHDTIKRLLGKLYSSIYQVSPTEPEKARKIQTVAVRVYLPTVKKWYECAIEPNGREV